MVCLSPAHHPNVKEIITRWWLHMTTNIPVYFLAGRTMGENWVGGRGVWQESLHHYCCERDENRVRIRGPLQGALTNVCECVFVRVCVCVLCVPLFIHSVFGSKHWHKLYAFMYVYLRERKLLCLFCRWCSHFSGFPDPELWVMWCVRVFPQQDLVQMQVQWEGSNTSSFQRIILLTSMPHSRTSATRGTANMVSHILKYIRMYYNMANIYIYIYIYIIYNL